LDPTHLPNPNYTGPGKVKGKMSLDQTHDNFELDLLKHNNLTLDEESDNNPTLDEESDNNPTLDEESTNLTLDEESTFFLTRIKKSIRKYTNCLTKCMYIHLPCELYIHEKPRPQKGYTFTMVYTFRVIAMLVPVFRCILAMLVL